MLLIVSDKKPYFRNVFSLPIVFAQRKHKFVSRTNGLSAATEAKKKQNQLFSRPVFIARCRGYASWPFCVHNKALTIDAELNQITCYNQSEDMDIIA